MKAIILAAGRGTRLRPITDTIPKPMICIGGKPILEHLLDKVYDGVTEIILIVKYKEEIIKEYFGENYNGTKITYITQGDEKGTGAALRGIKTQEDVFILYGDSILDSNDIQNILKSEKYGVFAQKVEDPSKYGIFKVNENNKIENVIEKPQQYIGNLANLGGFKMKSEILDIVKNITLSERGEYELTDALNLYIKNNDFYAFEIEGNFIDVGYPEDIKTANKFFEGTIQKPGIGKTQNIKKIDGYNLQLGISQGNIQKLIEYSQDLNDRSLQNDTSDLTRFSSYNKYSNWYLDTNRYVYSLEDHQGDLVGIWWGRPCKLPEIKEIHNQVLHKYIQENSSNLFTNGIRIYPKFRGKGLAKILLEAQKHIYQFYPQAIMCIDIDKENIPSQKSYIRSGYEVLGTGENKKTVEATQNVRLLFCKK